jgi:hypothetical protein
MIQFVLVCGLMVFVSVGPAAATPVKTNSSALLATKFHSLPADDSHLALSAPVESSPGVIGIDLAAFKGRQQTSPQDLASKGLLFCGLALVLFRWLQPAFAPRRFRL